MEKRELLRVIAPCGLMCHTCDAMKDGVINKAAKELLFVLGSYDSFLESCPGSRPISGKYPDFKEVLEYLANVQCKGCREDHCMGSDCIVPECVKGKGIDFCCQCENFPCDQTDFPSDLRDKWIRKNNKIKEIGMARYFEEEKIIPHYAS